MSVGKRFGNLNPFELHKRLINEYVLKVSGDTKLLTRDTTNDRTDADVLRENHRFLWDDDVSMVDLTWEQQLAYKYYDKLFKEYCICDLSRYKENKIALRWRTEEEVIDGRGQFNCAHKTCLSRELLRSWELNFKYAEDGQFKNALVKVRLCSDCSAMLNFVSKKREVKQRKRSIRSQLRSAELAKRMRKFSGGSSEAPRTTSASECETDRRDEKSTGETSSTKTETIAPTEAECWSKTTAVVEKTREEEFDKYLEELLL